MSDHFQSGMHLDPDALSAFLEGVLPEHERTACLAHLAECEECREAAYLAHEPLPEPAPQPVQHQPVQQKKRRWWFGPVPAFAAAALACTLVISVVLNQRRQSSLPPLSAPLTSAEVAPAPTTQAPTPADPPQKTGPKHLPLVRAGKAEPPSHEPPVQKFAATTGAGISNGATPSQPEPPQPEPPARTQSTAGATIPQFAPRTGLASGSIGGAPPANPAEVTGHVTDPTGAAIAGANVSVRAQTGIGGARAKTDGTGQFQIAGLTPGQYELTINSPGFQGTTRRIELKPDEVAKADSVLNAGSATDSVNVEASSAQINVHASASAASANSLPLSSRAIGQLVPPAVSNVTLGRITIETDSSGRLLFTNNGGKSWKIVKGKWQGKITKLDTTPEPAKPANTLFRLTTDAVETWLSRDGTHWNRPPAVR